MQILVLVALIVGGLSTIQLLISGFSLVFGSNDLEKMRRNVYQGLGALFILITFSMVAAFFSGLLGLYFL